MPMVEIVDRDHGDDDLDSNDRINDAVCRRFIRSKCLWLKLSIAIMVTMTWIVMITSTMQWTGQLSLVAFYIKLFNGTAADDRHGFIELNAIPRCKSLSISANTQLKRSHRLPVTRSN
ncbi:hypothetical protein RHGRI_028239 [Rhododendron griersonianum]|uniref:Uncharacterized protein n=1 Tax=Rhododendron griersonianum TaxID=479676 RepID=A0AAV6IIY0_9ERIC|nr:hypothetical protein RHGRI_028239 [Rhododendron griersonianum]